MTKQEYSYYIKWINMLAWRTLATAELPPADEKAVRVFIGNYAKGKFISDQNTLLKKVAVIADRNCSVKPANMPEMQNEYTKSERMAVNKGIRKLHKATDDNSRVKGYCQKYLYSRTGKRKTKTPSTNKLNIGRLTIAANAA